MQRNERSRIEQPMPAATGATRHPCVRNCCLNDRRVCLGCGRSMAEILEWNTADAARQREISGFARQRLQEVRLIAKG